MFASEYFSHFSNIDFALSVLAYDLFVSVFFSFVDSACFG